MIDNYILEIMAQNQIPGLSVAVVQESEPVWVKGYGLATVILLCNLDKISRSDANAKEIAGYYCPNIAK